MPAPIRDLHGNVIGAELTPEEVPRQIDDFDAQQAAERERFRVWDHDALEAEKNRVRRAT
jgi:hypothetical protein